MKFYSTFPLWAVVASNGIAPVEGSGFGWLFGLWCKIFPKSPVCKPAQPTPPACNKPPCERRLIEGEDIPVMEDMPISEVLAVIKKQEKFGASVDGSFSKRYDLISKESCDVLVNHVDQHLYKDIPKQLCDSWVSKEEEALAEGCLPVGTASTHGTEEKFESWASFADGGIDNQYNKKLHADEIVDMIGPEETKNIIDFFEESLGGLTIDSMYLARHSEPKGDLSVVHWYLDDYATVEITLNEDYMGGHVLHMNGEGVHKTEARPGSATAHGRDIMHGITPNTGGAKYMLILKHHYNRPDKVGVVRLSKAMVDEIVGNPIST